MITRDNGAGLSRDLRLIADVLRHGHDVAPVGLGSGRLGNRIAQWRIRMAARLWGAVDAQLSVERIYEPTLASARSNLLMPNPEWFRPSWTALLPRFERVLCKSRHAVEIFQRLGCATTYTGFTSEDRLDSAVPRERAFFHLAGRSSAKGTRVVLEAWRRHPEWPRLTVVQCARKARHRVVAANIDHRVGHLDDAELRRLQNAHRFHLCPSEVEGYGHYIAEAMSAGAVVITTDAAPMNELVAPGCGLLLPCSPGERLGLDVRHLVSVEAVEAAVTHALSMDEAACVLLGEHARARFLENDRAFRVRLQAVFDELPGLQRQSGPLDAADAIIP
ncbi:glycosyltransferase [Lysobacter auxotrophicus]|uniref:Glycosyltransferase n=1 Tax=Lysobacter auxotrophicus TaxID=2992573 RepID=A0ABN6UFV1_9GAMM|nr:glycosyltransferase [Lysobacter auxotrophicus]BDU15149.1 glycosyltransferase [Lysobacter auxotrophicus]